MEYVSRVLAPPLDRFVDDVYCLTGVPHHRRLNVPPMPSAHLMINLAGPACLYDSDPNVRPAKLAGGWFLGVWSRRFVIDLPSPVRLVGVHFKPWGVSPFFDGPLTELRDRWVPAEAVWGRSFDRLRDRISGAMTTGEMLQIIEADLRSRLPVALSCGLQSVERTARLIEASWGAVKVGALGDDVGVSGNHLAVQFKAHIGLSPKRVARIYRFARLILSVDAGHPVAWSRLAPAAGYFDQAHLSKEFKDFTGHTPTAYLELRRRFPAVKGFPPDNGPMPAE